MKKLLGFITAMFYLQVQAQFEAGTILAGGDMSFSRTNSEDTNNDFTTFRFAPRGAYFVLDHLAIGGIIRYTWLKPDDFDASTVIGIGPSARYYLEQGFFGELSLLYENGNNIDGRGVFGLGIGYAAFLNDHVAVEPALNYIAVFGEDIQNRTTIGLFVGFQVYLDNLTIQ